MTFLRLFMGSPARKDKEKVAPVLSFHFCFYFWILRIRHSLGCLGGDDVRGQ